MAQIPAYRSLSRLLYSLATAQALMLVLYQTFVGPAEAGATLRPLVVHTSSFSPLVDQDDPTSQALLRQLVKIATQIEQRSVTLTLDEALTQGLLNNPDLASAFYDIQGSEWNLIAARRSWYPTLKLTANTQSLKGQPDILVNKRFTNISTDSGDDTAQQTGSVAPGVLINWTFFDPTRTPAINQALSSLTAQRFLFDIAARDLVLNLQVAYTNVQAEAELVRRYQWVFEVTCQQVLAAERLVGRGLLPSSSLDQLHTEQRLQLTRLIDRYQQLFTASNALAALVAVPPGRMVLTTGHLVKEKPWQQDLDSSLDQALAMREEIKEKLSLASRDRWASIRAISGYLPSFGLSAAGAHEETQSMSNLTRISTANIGLSFQWPLFDGGILAANSSSLKSLSESQLRAANSQKLTVSKQVMDAYNTYTTSKLALQNTGADFSLSKKTVKDAIARFSSTKDVTTLVQVLSFYFAAADRDVGSTRQFNNAIYGLYRYSAIWPDNVSEKIEQRSRGAWP